MSALANVSRETQERLSIYETLLKKWNPAINLVAKSTIGELRERHFEDSLQILPHIPKQTRSLVDLGSGGGFPALPLAMALHERAEPPSITLIESDQRKGAFLRSVIRETNIQATVITDRIEEAPPQSADVVTARALADLTLLLSFAERHVAPNGVALLQKGRNWSSEVETAHNSWQFDCEHHRSTTESEAVLLEIKGISRV